MSVADYAALIIAVGSLFGSTVAFLNARTSKSQSDSAITNEAFTTASNLWRAAVEEARQDAADSRSESAQLHNTLLEATAELAVARDELVQARIDAKLLGIRVSELERTVGYLTVRLKEAGITLPEQ